MLEAFPFCACVRLFPPLCPSLFYIICVYCSSLRQLCRRSSFSFPPRSPSIFPPPSLCMDNGPEFTSDPPPTSKKIKAACKWHETSRCKIRTQFRSIALFFCFSASELEIESAFCPGNRPTPRASYRPPSPSSPHPGTKFPFAGKRVPLPPETNVTTLNPRLRELFLHGLLITLSFFPSPPLRR